MFTWFQFWLFVHIMAAIPAFGPTFVFPVVGPMIQKNPQHAKFGFEIFHAIETKLIVPISVTMPMSGILLIFSGHIVFIHSPWLYIGVGLYVIAMVLALRVQLPYTTRILEILSGGPPPGAGGGEGAPAGPPAELLRLIGVTRKTGQFLGLLLVTIVFLMILEPGGTVYST